MVIVTKITVFKFLADAHSVLVITQVFILPSHVGNLLCARLVLLVCTLLIWDITVVVKISTHPLHSARIDTLPDEL